MLVAQGSFVELLYVCSHTQSISLVFGRANGALMSAFRDGDNLDISNDKCSI
jgi:hypothetical protein